MQICLWLVSVLSISILGMNLMGVAFPHLSVYGISLFRQAHIVVCCLGDILSFPPPPNLFCTTVSAAFRSRPSPRSDDLTKARSPQAWTTPLIWRDGFSGRGRWSASAPVPSYQYTLSDLTQHGGEGGNEAGHLQMLSCRRLIDTSEQRRASKPRGLSSMPTIARVQIINVTLREDSSLFSSLLSLRNVHLGRISVDWYLPFVYLVYLLDHARSCTRPASCAYFQTPTLCLS